MKQKKLLLVAAAGAIMTIMFVTPAMAAAIPSTDITVTDNPAPPAGNSYSQQGLLAADSSVQTTPYPTDIQLFEQGERNYLYKTYTVASNYSPDLLVEPDFAQGGYRYKFSEIIQRDSIPGSMSKTASQTKSMETDTDDRADVLALFDKQIPYSDADGYKGDLFLMPDSLSITESGQEPYSYTLTETRQFDNLTNNDLAAISKTVVKNGVTLSLQDVDWQATGGENMGYSEVPTEYTAVARYAASVSGTRATGYTAIASYNGEVVKSVPGKNTYTIVYEGEQIVIPFNFVPLILAGIIVAGCVVAMVLIWRTRKNVTIYTLQQGVPELYAKVRVSPKNPVIDLSRISDVGVRLVFDKRFVKSLYDQKVFVIGRFTNYRINITGSLVQELPAQRYSEGAQREDLYEPEDELYGGDLE